MKGLFVVSVLFAVVLCVLASTIQPSDSGDFEQDGSYQDVAEMIPESHGNRMKRSPLDPLVAPLLIGKSFLYGALLGPKLFHRPRYHYYHPKPHYSGWGHNYRSYGGGWGWGK